MHANISQPQAATPFSCQAPIRACPVYFLPNEISSYFIGVIRLPCLPGETLFCFTW